jgi:hypothetical protein
MEERMKVIEQKRVLDNTKLNEDKNNVEKNYRFYTVCTVLQKVVFTLDNTKF